jgi:hypothetical protein
MAQVVLLRLDWDRTALPLRQAKAYYTAHISPEPGYLFGRKGLVIGSSWQQLAGRHTDGMVLLDGDVMLDPVDHRAMLDAIHEDPSCVHTAPVRIWPASTKWEDWTWAHWRTKASQRLETEGIRWFSFNFTYLPRALVEQAITAGLRSWAYPSVDSKMSRTAQRMGSPVRVVPGCWPKHLNY